MTRASLFLLALLVATGALAQQATYFARYEGDWSGGGRVQVEQLPEPFNVSCNVRGSREGETGFSLNGNCRAMLIMSREIGADIQRDPASGRYTGVYTGSSSGPARLDGRRRGDTLDLKVTWGRKIYDDNTARMLIRNVDGRQFRMQVVEKIEGRDVTVSDLTFTRN